MNKKWSFLAIGLLAMLFFIIDEQAQSQ